MALLCRPELLIADEPTTALDVTVQAQILHLLKEVQHEFNMAIILITHDMGVVANICDRVNVMYAGKLMESGNVGEIFSTPQHPYTQALLSSIPNIQQDVEWLITIPGEPPNVMNLPTGCAFQDRCPKVHAECRVGTIVEQVLANDRLVKCNLVKTKS
ncbi:MAG: oligopeptide/dipeptide ABC transporter ATP-binding protein [Burkholderiales bacterium]